jgi:hypothetical protein
MARATKRPQPPKPRFGESDRDRAWPDGFVFKHEPALPVTDEEVREIAASLNLPTDSKHSSIIETN